MIREPATASLLPRLTQARCEPTQALQIVDSSGERRALELPAERALTLYVERQEVVTLMTLGAEPEHLVLGWLLNQGLVDGVGAVESISVDWDVAAAAVRLRAGAAWQGQRLTQRTVTTGCGQGSVFGQWLDALQAARVPPPERSSVAASTVVEAMERMRRHPGVYRRAGSVHGSALFHGTQLLHLVEDVGRHNAVDTLTGWLALQGLAGAGLLLATTGRLTSEMVHKAACMGVPLVVSRNGATAMGLELAQRLGLTLLGRASGRRFLCYTGAERLIFDLPEPCPP